MDRFANLISGALKTGSTAHLDPDLLAAFTEHALARSDRDRVLGHLATCSECRQIVYLAASPSNEALQQGASFRPRHFRFVLKWGTALASIVILAFVFTTHTGRRPSQAPLPQVAVEKAPQEFDQLGTRDKITPPARGESRAAQAARPLAKHMTAAPIAKLKFEESGEVRVAEPASAPLNDKKQDAQESSLAKDQESGTAGKLPSKAVSATQAAEVTAGNAAGSGESKIAKSEAKPGLAGGISPRESYGRADVAQHAIAAAQTQWRLSPAGGVEKSVDSGRSWHAVAVANRSAFQALSVSGTSIWTGGEAGALYHSSDGGALWAQVVPEDQGQKLSADITRIDFSDSLNGSITTAGGEIWSTSDGGSTWSRK